MFDVLRFIDLKGGGIKWQIEEKDGLVIQKGMQKLVEKVDSHEAEEARLLQTLAR